MLYYLYSFIEAVYKLTFQEYSLYAYVIKKLQRVNAHRISII